MPLSLVLFFIFRDRISGRKNKFLQRICFLRPITRSARRKLGVNDHDFPNCNNELLGNAGTVQLLLSFPAGTRRDLPELVEMSCSCV
jgi:hypothetical protein